MPQYNDQVDHVTGLLRACASPVEALARIENY